ncbi:hypothetical protein D0C36_08915 [Mucilaginibacter conchicola]|uniref:DUF4595 domain-containing protein n=1 Tax=Mucilaginibacter conchicola TaxID=2303333 RepID=A0A372NZT2_9SPHI|nr:hypothetical protein [Mucilaginibacter conchicola]RFZ95620.1 hypothetical protein D0C36_08915 [Mucilaginibacter conchicola]
MNTITKNVAVAILSAVALLTASCVKENTAGPQPVKHQILKIEQGADFTTTFAYNANNLVGKVTTLQNGLSITANLTYNSDKKVIATSLKNLDLKYVYAEGKLSKVEFYTPAPENKLSFYNDLSYQNGKVTEQKGFAWLQNAASPDYKIVYTYNAAGDVATQQQFNWSTVANAYVAAGRSAFEYDNKPNPLTAIQGVNYTFFNAAPAHNIKKETVFNANGEQVAQHSYIYTYDADGYPLTATKKTTTADNPNVVATLIKFIYKN